MQFEEGLAEASGEGGSGLGDAALGTGELGGEAREEVVLSLLGSQDAYGRQYAKGVGAEDPWPRRLSYCYGKRQIQI